MRKYGSNFNKDLSPQQISALVKIKIKELTKKDVLPIAYKYSVTTMLYTGGRSINVNVKTGFPVRTQDEFGDWITLPEVITQSKIIKGILDSYNYDGTDVIASCSDVNFFAFVSFDK